MLVSTIYGRRRGKPLREDLNRERERTALLADAAEFARVRLRFVPDETQAEVLRSGARRLILNCSRQWGKSTVGAAMAVHRAYSRAGSLVVVASPTLRQSALLVAKAATFARRLGIRRRGDGDNECSMLFPNGSRIVGLPGTEGNVRGFSEVSLMLIDEASRVPEEMYDALRPMLAVGNGDLWLLSTPYRKRGYFYETWEYGPHWFKVKAPVTMCPRIDPEFVEEERAELPEDKFRREYLCEFQDDGAEVFDRDLLAEALDDEIHQLDVEV